MLTAVSAKSNLHGKLLKDNFSLQIAVAEQVQLFIRLPEALCMVQEACP